MQCSKQFTLAVSGERAYWTFQETVGDWMDKYRGIALPRVYAGSDWSSGLGKFGNGLVAAQTAFTANDLIANPLTWNIANSTGLGFWFWGKGDWASQTGIDLRVSIFPHTGPGIAYVRLSKFGPNNTCNLAATTISGAVSIVHNTAQVQLDQAWVFACASMDFTNNIIAIWDNMDGTLQKTLYVGPPIANFVAANRIDVSPESDTGFNGSTGIDEIGVFLDGPLNQTQVNYLFNSGAGQTWPIQLP